MYIYIYNRIYADRFISSIFSKSNPTIALKKFDAAKICYDDELLVVGLSIFNDGY